MSWKSFINEAKERQADGMAHAFGIISDSDYQNKRDEKPGVFDSLINKYTGAGLTREQAIQNDYQEYLSNTAYQRQVADMQAAGVNPALAIGSGKGASTPAASTGSNGGNFADLVSIMMLPSQLKQIEANIAASRAQANLANENAKNVAQDTKNKQVSEEQMRLNLQFDRELYDTNKESRQLANERQKADIAVTKERRNEIIANVGKLHAETKTESFKQALYETESNLNKAKSYEIYALVPYHQALMSAQTDQARGAAALSFANAAIQQGLLDSGYVERTLDKLSGEIDRLAADTRYTESQADFVETQRQIQEIKRKIASGQSISTEDIPKWKFTDRVITEFWNEFLQGMYQLSTAVTGPLVGAVSK